MTTAHHPGAQVEFGDLVDRCDLVHLLAAYGHHPARTTGSRALYRCPHPAHDDRTPSFTIDTDLRGRQRWRCWGQCAAGGDAGDLVQWLDGTDRKQARRRLADLAGIVPPPAPRPAPAPRRAPSPFEQVTVPANVAARVMADYLDRRRWPAGTGHRFGLTVVVDNYGHLRIRHPFYVPGSDGPTVATWQDRAVGSRRPKWDSASGRPLVPYNVCDLERDGIGCAVICEGPADTITARIALDPHPWCAVIGLAGTGAWRPEYADLFAGVAVITAVDADTAGRDLDARLAAALDGTAACVHSFDVGTLGCNDLGDFTGHRYTLADALLATPGTCGAPHVGGRRCAAPAPAARHEGTP